MMNAGSASHPSPRELCNSEAILKTAFTSQLVPQDPTDEPASALLERIREVRESTANPTKTARKSHAKTGTRRGR